MTPDSREADEADLALMDYVDLVSGHGLSEAEAIKLATERIRELYDFLRAESPSVSVH